MKPDPSKLQTAASREVLDQCVPLLYEELKKIARWHLRKENQREHLHTTLLTHEAYVRLAGYRHADWDDRQRFYAAASAAIRRFLVDHARGRLRQKRGGGVTHVPLGNLESSEPTADSLDVMDLEEALTELATLNERAALVVELRFLCGLKSTKIADLLGISSRGVEKDWSIAKAWLTRRLSPTPSPNP